MLVPTIICYMYVVFMLLHSHSFLILIRIRLVYQISFAAYHYTACGLSVSFLHCHSACQISKPDLIVLASDPAIGYRISSTNWYNCWSVTTWYCDCYCTTDAAIVMQKIGFLMKWRSQTTVAHIPKWTDERTNGGWWTDRKRHSARSFLLRWLEFGKRSYSIVQWPNSLMYNEAQTRRI